MQKKTFFLCQCLTLKRHYHIYIHNAELGKMADLKNRTLLILATNCIVIYISFKSINLLFIFVILMLIYDLPLFYSLGNKNVVSIINIFNGVAARQLHYLEFSKKNLLEGAKKKFYSSQLVIQFYGIIRLASIILYIPINKIEECKGLTTLTSRKDRIIFSCTNSFHQLNKQERSENLYDFIYFLFINSDLKIILVHTSETKYTNLLNT